MPVGFMGGPAFRTLTLFEVAVSLTPRNGAVLGQLFDRIGELVDTQQQIPRCSRECRKCGLK